MRWFEDTPQRRRARAERHHRAAIRHAWHQHYAYRGTTARDVFRFRMASRSLAKTMHITLKPSIEAFATTIDAVRRSFAKFALEADSARVGGESKVKASARRRGALAQFDAEYGFSGHESSCQHKATPEREDQDA